MIRIFGLIGFPLGHSFSKGFFSQKFEKEGIKDAQYELFPLENIDLLPQLIANNPDLCGFNVTIPYKEAVLPYLYAIDESAVGIEAVNVVAIKNGKLIGYNSDTYGFKKSLTVWLEQIKKIPTHVYILGTGGAAKGVKSVIEKMEMPFTFVSRKKTNTSISYEDFNILLEKNNSQLLIVNATPLGTFPNVTDAPAINYDFLTDKILLYDLVYNPPITAFMQKGISQGCETKNGLEMLHLQAEKAWEFWNT